MEEINNSNNNDLDDCHVSQTKSLIIDKNYKKLNNKKYNSKEYSNQKKLVNTLASINDIRKKQRQIKQCFLDITNTKKKKEKNILKNKIRTFHQIENEEKENITQVIYKSELKTKRYDNKTKNIKHNKIKIEKINLDTAKKSNFIINRHPHKEPSENNKNKKLIIEESNINNKYLLNFYNSPNKNTISVKDFNKTFYDKNLLNKVKTNLEYIKLINPSTSIKNENTNHNNRYNISENTLNKNINKNSIELKKDKNKSTKISFKNTKRFYAHLEIFISLYLKRIFKCFIKIIKHYERPNIFINNIEQLRNERPNINNYGPIFNVNNAHCSLYYSINVNQNKLYNTIFDNRNIYSIANNTINPIIESSENTKNPQMRINNCNFISPENHITVEFCLILQIINFNFFSKKQTKI